MLAGRLRPTRGVFEVEPLAVAPRAPRRPRLDLLRSRVEDPVGVQPDQDPRRAPFQSAPEFHWIVAGVEGEDRYTASGSGSRRTRARTCSAATSSVSCVGRTRLASPRALPTSRARSRAGPRAGRPNRRRWADRRSSASTGGGSTLAPGSPPRRASRPHRDVHRVDRGSARVPISEGVPREQAPQTSFVHASHAERGVEATPAAPMDGRQAHR